MADRFDEVIEHLEEVRADLLHQLDSLRYLVIAVNDVHRAEHWSRMSHADLVAPHTD